MDTIAQGIFDLLFNMINVMAHAIFLPVQYLFSNFLTGLLYSEFLQNFYNMMNQYVVPFVGWFVNLVPPFTWNVLLLHFSIVIGLYTIVGVLHFILKPLKIIKKVIPLA